MQQFRQLKGTLFNTRLWQCGSTERLHLIPSSQLENEQTAGRVFRGPKAPLAPPTEALGFVAVWAVSTVSLCTSKE